MKSAAAAAARASFTDALGIFGLLALLLVALAFATASRRRDEFAVDTVKMTTTGVSTLCSIASSQAYDACGPDLNVRRRMFFHDETKSTTPAMDADGTTGGETGNNSDPYFMEKVVAGANSSSLRLTINDDADESFQIWGNACATTGCAGAGAQQHKFRGDGSASHSGSLVLGAPGTATDNGWSSASYPQGGSLNIYNRHAGNWTQFPGTDDRNYIRNDTQVDGNLAVNGTVGMSMRNNGSGVTWGDSQSRIHDNGDLHIDTDDTLHLLAPSSVDVQTPRIDVKNPSTGQNLRFSSAWSGSPDAANGVNSEISNDVGAYKALMLVGNRSAGGQRRVGVWDRLDVHGNVGIDQQLCIGGTCITEADLRNIKNTVAQEAALEQRVGVMNTAVSAAAARDAALDQRVGAMNTSMSQQAAQQAARIRDLNAAAAQQAAQQADQIRSLNAQAAQQAKVTNAIVSDAVNAAYELGAYNMGPWNAWNFADRSARWIWNEAGAAGNAGNGCATYQKLFVSQGGTQAVVHAICDNQGVVFFNGDEVGRCNGGWGGGNYSKATVNVLPGQNVLSIQGRNMGGPAGLLAALVSSGGQVLAHTDRTWTWSSTCGAVPDDVIKPGNNGTVSCDTYGAGGWAGGPKGACVNATQYDVGQIDCGKVAAQDGQLHNVTCECSPN